MKQFHAYGVYAKIDPWETAPHPRWPSGGSSRAADRAGADFDIFNPRRDFDPFTGRWARSRSASSLLPKRDMLRTQGKASHYWNTQLLARLSS